MHETQPLTHFSIVKQVCAILPQHKLDHIRWRFARPANLLGEILANHQTRKGGKKQVVKFVCYKGCFGYGHGSLSPGRIVPLIVLSVYQFSNGTIRVVCSVLKTSFVRKSCTSILSSVPRSA